jgi:hypothetical protein
MASEKPLRILNDHDSRLEALEMHDSFKEVHRRYSFREKAASYSAGLLLLAGCTIPPAVAIEMHASDRSEAKAVVFGVLGGMVAAVSALGYRLSSEEKAKSAAKSGLKITQMLDEYPERWIRQELKLDLVGPTPE